MCTPFTSCYFAFSLLAAGDKRTESVRLTKFNQFWQKEHLCGPYYGRENFTINLFVIFIFLKCRVNWAWPARKLAQTSPRSVLTRSDTEPTKQPATISVGPIRRFALQILQSHMDIYRGIRWTNFRAIWSCTSRIWSPDAIPPEH